MSNSKRCKLRNLLYVIQLVITDEIPMVSNTTFLRIHQRLREILGFSYDKPLAGKTVLVVGDLLHLPPVKSCFVFTPIDGTLRDMFTL